MNTISYMKLAYFDCFAGVSGDMIIGSLLDCGLKLKDLKKALAPLKLPGLCLNSREVIRQGLRGRQFIVPPPLHPPFRNLTSIKKLLNKSGLDPDIKKKALEIFAIIARAEGKVHCLKPGEVHFHEIGAIDTIVDVVGCLSGLRYLGIEEIYASALPLGRGMVSTAHGQLPVPAPATVEILKGYPVNGLNLPGELTTPTGAAIISFLSRGLELPSPWKIEKVGYGAGSRDTPHPGPGVVPNLVRLFIGRREENLKRDEALVVETNIDNMDPQAYELIMERLFKAGALDVFITNIIMKKGRPSHKLTVLAGKDKLDILTRVIFENAPTLGVRIYQVERLKLARRLKSFKTPFGLIKVKEIRDIDGRLRRYPEADEVLRLARANSMPYAVINKKIIDIINGL